MNATIFYCYKIHIIGFIQFATKIIELSLAVCAISVGIVERTAKVPQHYYMQCVCVGVREGEGGDSISFP